MMVTNKDIKQWEPLLNKVVSKYRQLWGNRSDIDWDDMKQAGYIGLLGALRSYNPETGISFPYYAGCLIARELKKQFTFYNKFDNVTEYVDNTASDKDTSTIDNRLDDDIYRNEIRKIISQLLIDDKTKKILMLVYSGYSYQEVMDILNVSYGQVTYAVFAHKDSIVKKMSNKFLT